MAAGAMHLSFGWSTFDDVLAHPLFQGCGVPAITVFLAVLLRVVAGERFREAIRLAWIDLHLGASLGLLVLLGQAAETNQADAKQVGSFGADQQQLKALIEDRIGKLPHAGGYLALVLLMGVVLGILATIPRRMKLSRLDELMGLPEAQRPKQRIEQLHTSARRWNWLGWLVTICYFTGYIVMALRVLDLISGAAYAH